ncbi:uncharacterized protein TRIADDRAFT_56768 [Trichoplax adhaerens]|uniref:Uncharacterized protein n=1 Tax=Trichoplax adhaerens TaxID=10228 RepID=B3RWJ2_TRIAD|nr:hypothetical protein TRIADDRAFT_56768 [Trichoplax adhaerens]EDV25145.1 hypothetical protein TRIADDRAFT_56768 [Trichoplax adhaerens]|eukprot:XP_002113035.1 hypothetical protein TRIADDRAFT_56768 [Trichoplax adhaerens]
MSTQQAFFEGTEKLLEIWFASSDSTQSTQDGRVHDLREISKDDWSELLTYANCSILSEVSSNDITAYLLSESSLFVSSNRFILKTCGVTTLLNALAPLLKLAKEKCNFDIVENAFYSRRKFQQPHLQKGPHNSFDTEVTTLENFFENGAAYALGRLNGDTCLDPSVMAKFTIGEQSGEEIAKEMGIADLVPGATIDAKLFDPCGYSINGVVNNFYFTIHVTPQHCCSYVSFETNYPQSSYRHMIETVINIFKPGSFVMTLFANEATSRNSQNE